jgi:HD superfamily phosphodiesterase
MNIEINIRLAQKKLIPSLEEFFRSVYDDKKLPSHGIDHHRRVWEYAKELLHFINQERKIADSRFIEKLIICCYLHDIGMAIDTGDRHGYHSRKLCERFLTENNLDQSDYLDVMEAIDNHDKKEYSDFQSESNLLRLLSAADDLDAFGYTGIYRYIEIYLARGIQPGKIGQMIRVNAETRFKYFSFSFASFPELVKKHKARYMVLDNFFEGLCKEFDSNG